MEVEVVNSEERALGMERNWHLAFNLLFTSADDLPRWMVQPAASLLKDVACFKAVMEGCTAALDAQQQPMLSELLLLKRIIHRNKSQHRNSMHLRAFLQLRLACERLHASGLTLLFATAKAATHEDSHGGSVCGNTMASRELLELLLARHVTAAVLSQRAKRAACLAFRANEQLIQHALFMPLAVTGLSLSARFIHLTTTYAAALAESYLRLSAMRARAPVCACHALEGGAGSNTFPAAHSLLECMLVNTQPHATCPSVPSDFQGLVACLRRLLSDTSDISEEHAHTLDDSAPPPPARASTAGSERNVERDVDIIGKNVDAATAATACSVSAAPATTFAGDWQIGSYTVAGGGDKCKESGNVRAATATATEQEEDEGVSVEDVGVSLRAAFSGGHARKADDKKKPSLKSITPINSIKAMKPMTSATPKTTCSASTLGNIVSDDAYVDRKCKGEKKKKKLGGIKLVLGASASGSEALAALSRISQQSNAVAPKSGVLSQSSQKNHVKRASVSPIDKNASLPSNSARCADGTAGEKAVEQRKRPPESAAGSMVRQQQPGSAAGGELGGKRKGVMDMLMPSRASFHWEELDPLSGGQAQKKRKLKDLESGTAGEAGVEERKKLKVTSFTASSQRSHAVASGEAARAGGSACPPLSTSLKSEKKKNKKQGLFADLFTRSSDWGR